MFEHSNYKDPVFERWYANESKVEETAARDRQFRIKLYKRA
jgi:hypothetical protein